MLTTDPRPPPLTSADHPAPRLPGIGEMIVSARPTDEYRAMFGLSDDDLGGPILDCPGGAGDFGAAVRAAGGATTSADPLYALPRDEVVATARAGTLRGNRYVAAALPHLPFADRAFALALSGHLLFTYPGHLAYEDHLAALRELVRVSAGEARIFPLLDTELTVYPPPGRAPRRAGRGGHRQRDPPGPVRVPARSEPHAGLRARLTARATSGSERSG